jgi:hypothetical protein
MDELDRILKKTLSWKPKTGVISPESVTKLHRLRERGEFSEWVSKACEFYYDYERNTKGFFIRLIEFHFEEIKHLLRIIGRARKENFKK